MTYQRLLSDITGRLSPHYGASESKAMAQVALQSLKGWDRTAMVLHMPEEASDFIVSEMERIASELLLDRPLQYILGNAPFHGMTLAVNPSTLIPRPETSQLVDLTADRLGNSPDLRVLDIGTGSGAIAIALAKTLKFPVVTAIDISLKAIETAKENARLNKVTIKFETADIFQLELPHDSFDAIVSNPPYVTESERPSLAPNVSLYEPSQALFVPDKDPLVFYREISRKAKEALVSGGLLAFEINSRFGAETARLLRSMNFSDVEVEKDFRGLDRFVFARKP